MEPKFLSGSDDTEGFSVVFFVSASGALDETAGSVSSCLTRRIPIGTDGVGVSDGSGYSSIVSLSDQG